MSFKVHFIVVDDLRAKVGNLAGIIETAVRGPGVTTYLHENLALLQQFCDRVRTPALP